MNEKIPLANRIKKESHKQIASAQDIILEEVYKEIPEAILHGGTSIWRCYSGKRFSEDLDFYLPKDTERIASIFKSLEKKGFKIIKKKISERSVYSELSIGRTTVRLEATFQEAKPALLDYEKIDGTLISIYGLDLETLLKEKTATFIKRRKIRDLYDVYFLLRLVNDMKPVKKEIKELIDNYSDPEDESDLKVIIIEGITPRCSELIEYIRRKWENPNI